MMKFRARRSDAATTDANGTALEAGSTMERPALFREVLPARSGQRTTEPDDLDDRDSQQLTTQLHEASRRESHERNIRALLERYHARLQEIRRLQASDGSPLGVLDVADRVSEAVEVVLQLHERRSERTPQGMSGTDGRTGDSLTASLYRDVARAYYEGLMALPRILAYRDQPDTFQEVASSFRQAWLENQQKAIDAVASQLSRSARSSSR